MHLSMGSLLYNNNELFVVRQLCVFFTFIVLIVSSANIYIYIIISDNVTYEGFCILDYL